MKNCQTISGYWSVSLQPASLTTVHHTQQLQQPAKQLAKVRRAGCCYCISTGSHTMWLLDGCIAISMACMYSPCPGDLLGVTTVPTAATKRLLRGMCMSMFLAFCHHDYDMDLNSLTHGRRCNHLMNLMLQEFLSRVL